MKKINVRKIHQDPESGDCGPVSAQMILAAFGIKKDLESLKQEINYVPIPNVDVLGTYAYGLGTLLIKNGLKVEIVTGNPWFFKVNELGKFKTKASLIKHLESFTEQLKDKKEAVKQFVEFLNNGGKFKIERPLEKHITNTISKSGLVLASVYPKVYDKNQDDWQHALIVNGYDGESFYICDPYPKSKINKVKKDEFMFALAAGLSADVDNGSLLMVHQ